MNKIGTVDDTDLQSGDRQLHHFVAVRDVIESNSIPQEIFLDELRIVSFGVVSNECHTFVRLANFSFTEPINNTVAIIVIGLVGTAIGGHTNDVGNVIPIGRPRVRLEVEISQMRGINVSLGAFGLNVAVVVGKHPGVANLAMDFPAFVIF